MFASPERALRRRLDQARRDLRMVAGTLRGVRPPVTVPRRPKRPGRSALGTRSLRVDAVIQETRDAVTLRLSDVSGAPLRFHPGQFLSLDVVVGGRRHRRAYSLSGALGAPAQVTVKRVPGGVVSSHLVETAQAGDVLAAFGPAGRFGFAPDPRAERRLLLVAGGSGITPLVSLAESVLAAEPRSRVTLLYGNRRAEDVIFRERLGALATRYGARFRICHVLEAPAADLASTAGRLGRERMDERLRALGIEHDVEAYVCGPTDMMEAVRAALEGHGIDRIHEERFQRPEERRGAGAALPTEPVPVSFGEGDVRHTALVAPGDTLLEAGRKAGLALPFSCAMGGCGACRVRLRKGAVAMEEPNCLSADERSAGDVLACVARPTEACEVELP